MNEYKPGDDGQRQNPAPPGTTAKPECVRKEDSFLKKCQTPGYISRDFPIFQFFARLVIRFILFLQLGSVRVRGAKNLKIKGPVLFCPNHPSTFDFILYPFLPSGVRTMGSVNEFVQWGGWKGVLVTLIGGFPVDQNQGKNVLAPATEVLCRKKPMLIFPEGQISDTDEVQPFKKGPAYITLGAWKKMDRQVPVALVPMHVKYHGRDPSTAHERNYFKIGFKWRKGVTITVGEPIYIGDVEHLSPQEIMDMMRDKVIALGNQ